MNLKKYFNENIVKKKEDLNVPIENPLRVLKILEEMKKTKNMSNNTYSNKSTTAFVIICS